MTSAVIMLAAVLLGSGANVLSFITEQTGRGLQIEAPISTFWLWQIVAGTPGTFVFYDRLILTFQVAGNGVDAAAAIMTPVLGIVIAIIALLGVRATRAGVPAGDLFPSLTLAFVTALIAFNKVGSPQYVAWLAVPIVLGLATYRAGYGRSFGTPAIITLVIAGLTQTIYPYLYDWLLTVSPLILIVLTARNLLFFVLLGWAVWAIVTSPLPDQMDPHSDDAWLPSVWPFVRDVPQPHKVKE